jgi:Secretion system C-terminal sorting domain
MEMTMKTTKTFLAVLFLAMSCSECYSQPVLERIDEFRAGITENKEQNTTISSDDSRFVINGNELVYIINTPELLSKYNTPDFFNGKGLVNNGSQKTEISSANNIPEKFDLLQNFPNPFNPVTVIKYQLPVASYLSIKLYDQMGREISVLFEGNQQAGYYQTTVDGTNLASGIYFCRITSGNSSSGSGNTFNKTIKMSLIK